MVGRRVLIVGALAATCFGSTGCTLGPIWASDVEGIVVDVDTGKPVAGVEVFLSAFVHGPLLIDVKASRWATTDENGRFRIEGEIQVYFVPFARTDSVPAVVLYHPDYGFDSPIYSAEGPTAYPSGPLRKFKISSNVTGRSEWASEMIAQENWDQLCWPRLTEEGCQRLVEVIKSQGGSS